MTFFFKVRKAKKSLVYGREGSRYRETWVSMKFTRASDKRNPFVTRNYNDIGFSDKNRFPVYNLYRIHL